MRKKQALDKDVLMVASDIAKKSRAYLNWHDGKGYAGGFSLHQFRSALADFADFINQLEYKADWAGRTIAKIDQFFPSSKRCSR